jgi:inosose dehydratase
MISRRTFVKSSLAALPALARAAEEKKFHLATNVYPWYTFYGREKRDFNKVLDASLAEVSKAGLDGLEPILDGMGMKAWTTFPVKVKKAGLEIRSWYVNAKLHDKEGKAVGENLVAFAKLVTDAGLKILVVNPTPLRWGGSEDKSDEQLTRQAENLDALGKALKKLGVTLAYHNHDAEMRRSAREFHHMMNGTDEANVSLCLDSHWIYRGSGDSQVALFDVVKLYGKRVVELHLRQSSKGVWTEAFGDGDIDHGRLVKTLAALKLRPHLVLEQAVEAKSPNTMKALEAHAKGAAYARKLLGPIA